MTTGSDTFLYQDYKTWHVSFSSMNALNLISKMCCSKRKPLCVLLTLPRHVVALMVEMVASQCSLSRDVDRVILFTGSLKSGYLNAVKLYTTMEYVYNESRNFAEGYAVHVAPSNLIEMVPVIGIEGIGSGTRHFYARGCLTSGLCCLIKSASMGD